MKWCVWFVLKPIESWALYFLKFVNLMIHHELKFHEDIKKSKAWYLCPTTAIYMKPLSSPTKFLNSCKLSFIFSSWYFKLYCVLISNYENKKKKEKEKKKKNVFLLVSTYFNLYNILFLKDSFKLSIPYIFFHIYQIISIKKFKT